MHVLGIDIGGSGIKGAIVDTEKGTLVSERHRIPTPHPSTPEAVSATVAELVRHFDWHGPVGCGFPAAIRSGIVMTAANIDKRWIGVPVAELLSATTNCPFSVANDADVAALAEMHFGAGKGEKGTVLVVTVGTGLGTALFHNGQLLPNTELGHIWLKRGIKAEHYASDAVRKGHDLTWERWGRRFNKYLKTMERLFWPDKIILGGGASKKLAKYQDQITITTPVEAAATLNQAGIVGAALLTQEQQG